MFQALYSPLSLVVSMCVGVAFNAQDARVAVAVNQPICIRYMQDVKPNAHQNGPVSHFDFAAATRSALTDPCGAQQQLNLKPNQVLEAHRQFGSEFRPNRTMPAASPLNGQIVEECHIQAGAELLGKTKLCKFFAKGQCTRGKACTFAHGKRELRETPDLYHTEMCFEFLHTGRCRWRSHCRYAHSLEEMQRAEATVPPPTTRKQKLVEERRNKAMDSIKTKGHMSREQTASTSRTFLKGRMHPTTPSTKVASKPNSTTCSSVRSDTGSSCANERAYDSSDDALSEMVVVDAKLVVKNSSFNLLPVESPRMRKTRSSPNWEVPVSPSSAEDTNQNTCGANHISSTDASPSSLETSPSSVVDAALAVRNTSLNLVPLRLKPLRKSVSIPAMWHNTGGDETDESSEHTASSPNWSREVSPGNVVFATPLSDSDAELEAAVEFEQDGKRDSFFPARWPEFV